ncbi:MAG TPA: hypothetical protein VLK56_05130, partial [Solirubrobacterales bacterium]|nr:hypothetical protein [Solirubrobacterales bacterium]
MRACCCAWLLTETLHLGFHATHLDGFDTADAIEEVDRALVHHIEHPDEFERLQAAIDALTDTLLSHLSYEEHELVEP